MLTKLGLVAIIINIAAWDSAEVSAGVVGSLAERRSSSQEPTMTVMQLTGPSPSHTLSTIRQYQTHLPAYSSPPPYYAP